MKYFKYPVFLGTLLILLTNCNTSYDEPRISLKGYEVESGFELDVIASEPLLKAPVQIDFDSKGRIWVAEMSGFMQDIAGTDEDLPSGAIKILEDKDEDGVMDQAIIFIDSLVMPRALTLVYGGLLYAEPPNLYFVEIDKNDRPQNRVLVDSLYALEGNPEHQPNGLELNIDNWIYNAGSHFRYQRKNGNWIKEPTTHRGQWGMSHDNLGRLYYNNNSTQLLGDYILPNRMIRNEFLQPQKGVNQKLSKDQRVYPLHAAKVNRGYVEGVLDKDSLLLEVTAACGPLVYRGGVFSDEYEQNVFVCIPEINAVKRNILTFYGDSITGQQAWHDKEFLASTDEGFRPVNLSTSPDGSMYVIDMHRGIIQHHAFLSPYLKKLSKQMQLDTLINFGRILRVGKKSIEKFSVPDLDEVSSNELVELLKHKNGFIRDQAQHRLVYKEEVSAVTELQQLAQNIEYPIAQMHALNTLNGIGTGLSFDLLLNIAEKSNVDVISHVLVLLEDYVAIENKEKARQLFRKLIKKESNGVDLYLATVLGKWSIVSKDDFNPIIKRLVERHENSQLITEALLSGMSLLNEDVLTDLNKPTIEDSLFQEQFSKNIKRKEENKKNSIYVSTGANEDSRTKGAKLYRKICAACHLVNGTGAEELAPPLVESEHILPPEKLTMIILHGLKGPIEVAGKIYNLNHAMPGLNTNESLSDKDISSIISYVTNAFSKNPSGFSPEKVKELRELKSKNGSEYTLEELEKKLDSLSK
ncbi:c-type cytochrome [Zobellia nedashkovskayae]|uniref:DUF7133 domain-containing protein n=1 Tax=Zobellia nedashkovskayae TaxID=2779510 RepID=UPI00188A43B7|nr:c-type cytochrome [Zobellia nedashkovskayae]